MGSHSTYRIQSKLGPPQPPSPLFPAERSFWSLSLFLFLFLSQVPDHTRQAQSGIRQTVPAVSSRCGCLLWSSTVVVYRSMIRSVCYLSTLSLVLSLYCRMHYLSVPLLSCMSMRLCRQSTLAFRVCLYDYIKYLIYMINDRMNDCTFVV